MNFTSPNPVYLTTDEYAALRKCSPRTLERERCSGTGCRYIRRGRKVLYRADDVHNWLADGLRTSTAEG